jgi:hypothetical protein
VQARLRASRLNLARGLRDHHAERRTQSALERLFSHHDDDAAAAAAANLERLFEQRPALELAWAS